jgi:hypothetical protein
MSGCRIPPTPVIRNLALLVLACLAQPLRAQDLPLRAPDASLRSQDLALPDGDAVAASAPRRNEGIPSSDAARPSANDSAPDSEPSSQDGNPPPADSTTSQDTGATDANGAPADASARTADASTAAPNGSGSPLYYDQPVEPPAYGVPGIGIVQRVPASDFGTPQYGVPYASVFGGQDGDPFSNHAFGLNVNQEGKVGGVEGNVDLGYAGISVPSLPFIHHSAAPQDADLKIGPIYFFLDTLTAALLYTDNYNLTEHNRKSETLAIISLNMTLVAQLTEDLQFSVTGSLVYLPIQNIVGFESSSLQGSLGFLLAALPALAANVSYDTLIAGWPVQFRDVFQTATGSYSDNTLDDFDLFEGSSLQKVDGKYVFRSARVDLRNNNQGNNSYASDDYFNFFSNTLSATTLGYLPTDIQVTARAARSDLWYNQDNRGLPSSRDDFYILAQSERPTMRFKPFASYEIEHTSDVPGVYQIVEAGLSGPINDQLFLYTDFGYYRSNTGQQGYLFSLELNHTAGEYTTEQLSIRRDLNDFDDEVITTEYYRITQVLGPTVSAVGFADHSTFNALANDQVVNRTQEDFGLGLTWVLGPLTNLQVQGVYARQDYDDNYSDEVWTARVNLSRTITDTLHMEALYQYQNYRANETDHSYYENLFYVSLVKYFH